jgi:hypothetical protein
MSDYPVCLTTHGLTIVNATLSDGYTSDPRVIGSTMQVCWFYLR